MSEFINTRAVIGDQETVDGLVEGSLTELKEDGVETLASCTFYRNDSLQVIELPGITTIAKDAMKHATGITTLKLGGYGTTGSITFGQDAFRNCLNFKHLVIDRPTVATINANGAFENSGIHNRNGVVYVPDNLVETYKADSVWRDYYICSILDYPRATCDSIDDSWAEIFMNPNYASDYSVGDTKTMELTDGKKIRMVIAALDSDTKADGTGTAKITWLCNGIPYLRIFHSSNSVFYNSSSLRTWLNDTLYQLIPTTIRDNIVTVTKSVEFTSSVDDNVWIPSVGEVGLATSTAVQYTGIFHNASTRMRSNGSALDVWWLRNRTTSSSGYTQTVRVEGTLNGRRPTEQHGVLFGFCTD